MKINNKYVTELIITAIYHNKLDYCTPEEQCGEYDYEDRRSIKINDLREILNDIFGIEEVK